MDNNEKIVVFEGKQIRKIIHNNEWWFSIADVCGALTDSPDAGVVAPETPVEPAVEPQP